MYYDYDVKEKPPQYYKPFKMVDYTSGYAVNDEKKRENKDENKDDIPELVETYENVASRATAHGARVTHGTIQNLERIVFTIPLMQSRHSLSINPTLITATNADFDGDEVNLNAIRQTITQMIGSSTQPTSQTNNNTNNIDNLPILEDEHEAMNEVE